MTMFNSKKKKIATGVIAGVAVVSLAGGAFAYFTNAGTGTGSATVGSSTPISLAGVVTGTLYPEGNAASVSVLVTNGGAGSQAVGNVHLASITTDGAHSLCDLSVGTGAAFTMNDITVGTTLTKAGTLGDHTTVIGSLQMHDTGVAQDECQGAPLTLHFTSN